MSQTRDDRSPMAKAVDALYSLRPMPTFSPKDDPRYIALKQLHEFNARTLERARAVEDCAYLARLEALKAHSETLVRLEILEVELQIDVPKMYRDEELDSAETEGA